MILRPIDDIDDTMLFTSPLFLFAFLPAVILCYYACKSLAGHRFKNALLLLFSYLFYLCGAGQLILLLLFSTLVDYGIGLLIVRSRSKARFWVFCSLGVNLGLLVYFKYSPFFVTEFSRAVAPLGVVDLTWPTLILPLGISFFTFQKISYIIDVYRRQVKPMANPMDFALYVAMFPQLVAGPIVRFKDIRRQLVKRVESWDTFYQGTLRFCWGLAKKVLIADACGQIADAAFGLPIVGLDTKTAWLGALAYTLQIYFDFSAYSDMAIGLAAFFGVRLRENFQHPYLAVGLTDFWRRWHISLSRWFKDYLYLPLGGNRQGTVRTAFNLLAVFLLCGLWHGAAWTFIIWGLYHGFFLIIERGTGLRQLPAHRARALRRVTTLAIIIFGWVLFRSDSISSAWLYIQTMVVPRNLPLTLEMYSVLHYRNIVFFGLAALSFFSVARQPGQWLLFPKPGIVRTVMGIILIFVVLPYCTAFIIDGTGNPFIYFRF